MIPPRSSIAAGAVRELPLGSAANLAALAFPAAVLLVLVSALLGANAPLLDLNEGLYARVAQEMLDTGRFLVPMLDGVPYVEKPPLMYWITAASLSLFGTSALAARAVPMIGFALTVTAMIRFARRTLGDDRPWPVLWMAASAPVLAVLDRTLICDLLLTGLLAWSLVLLHEAFDARGSARGRLRASYALLALAVMTKALLPAVVYGGVALGMLLADRAHWRARLRLMLDPKALLALLAIAAPWHVAAALAQPGFAWFYFVNEHVLRFLDLRVPHDYHLRPWWHYGPWLAAYAFPWIVVFALPLRLRKLESARARSARRLLWLWFLVPLAIFSCSQSKGDYYMVIGTPPLLLLAADRIARVARREAWLVAVPAAWIVFVVALVVLAPARLAGHVVPEHAGVSLAVTTILAVVSTAAFAARRTQFALAACAAAALPCLLLFTSFLSANEAERSSRLLAAELKAWRGAKVFLFHEYETISSLPFYLHRNVGVIDSQSKDLWYGTTLRPDWSRFVSAKDLAARSEETPFLVIVSDGEREAFMRTPLADAVTAQTRVGKRAVFASERALAEAAARR